jgi:hypothetical protein
VAIQRELNVLIFILYPLLIIFSVLTSSKISKKAKRNALDLLNDELDGDTPRHYLDEVPDQSKEQEK